jgi:hypothetical protein
VKYSWLCAPALSFIVVYWGLCLSIKYHDGDIDDWLCVECCKKRKKKMMGKKKTKKLEPPKNSERTRNTDDNSTIDIGTKDTKPKRVARRRRSSFIIKGRELELSKIGKGGHLRQLYADGPEFVGLLNEVHAINSSMREMKHHIKDLINMNEKDDNNKKLMSNEIKMAMNNVVRKGIDDTLVL